MEKLELLDIICMELGIELDKPFYGVISEGKYNKYKLKSDGKLFIWQESINGELDGWYFTAINPLLTGKIKPVWIPEMNELYYYPAISYKHLVLFTRWTHDTLDLYRLEKGFVFKDKQDAIDKATEMLDILDLVK